MTEKGLPPLRFRPARQINNGMSESECRCFVFLVLRIILWVKNLVIPDIPCRPQGTY